MFFSTDNINLFNCVGRMADENLEEPEIAPSSSPKLMQNFVEPELTASTNEYDSSNLQNKETAKAPMQEELPASLIGNKSHLQEISIEQKALISVSATLSSEVDNSELLSARDPHGFPMISHKDDESTEPYSDSTTIPPSEGNTHSTSQTYDSMREVVQLQHTPLHNIQDDAFSSDSSKVFYEMPPALPEKVKEKKPHLMHRFHERQLSLRDTRQKAPAPLNRSNSGKYFRTDNTFVDTTTHIESVKVAASRFGGSINWKTRKTELEQEAGHAILELGRLKKEILNCKWQVEAAEAAKVSLSNEYEKTKKLIEGLEHDLEKAQEEEIYAKLNLLFFQLIVHEMEEGVTSDGRITGREKFNVIKEQYNTVLANLTLVKDESTKVLENYETLLIERDISIGKAQVAVALSKDAVRKVEELTVELNKLKAELELAHSTCHDAEHSIAMSLARDEDSIRWETDLREAEQELKQLIKKISSIEELKSMLHTSTALLLKLKNELAAYVEAKLIEEAQGSITQRSLHNKVILSTQELEECLISIDKVRNEVCSLNVAAASLKTELTKEKAALATMQEMDVMSSITAASLKVEIQLAQQELEAVQAKEKESRNGMLGLQKIMEDKTQEADAAKSIAREAQEKLRKAKEDMEHAKSGQNTMEFMLQAVLKEMEAAKESERVALDALRSLKSERAVDTEEQSSWMIILDLDEYQSLVEKSNQAEELVHERTAAAIAQVKMAKESEYHTLSTLSETFKVLEQRKQALVAAAERADKATEGKLAMEQELRKWREENEQRRKADGASKSEHKPSSTTVIIVECSGDTKSTSKEDASASVHPLLVMSARNSPNDSSFLVKKSKTKKRSFFPRIITFFTRKKFRAAK
ncbi:hypothetical protein E2562_024571 [Oryza meyeriana var. granulata]|uniref:Uncharacterized protein n=1 Tax=Oryza meyeriana var. granulata TaxID=110450 RepID=A0A6G1CR61_9ORYZ|nr:hypothetical protein E2562_024571 [Oryza meyeriana var. granulata]